MSGVGEPEKSRSEDTPEDDHESDTENQESSNTPKTPTLLGSDPTADAKKTPTNGDEMPPKSTGNPRSGSAHSTPPRCDSPTLRKLLTSPMTSRGQSSLLVDELQGSEADMQKGIVPDALQGTEAVGGDIPEAVHTAEIPEADQRDVPEAELIPEAIPEAVQGTEAQGVTEAEQIPEAVPEAVQSAEGANVLKTVLGAEKNDIPEAKKYTAAAEHSILKSLLETGSEVSSVPEAVQNVVDKEMSEATNVPEGASDATANSVLAKSEITKETEEQMRTSESKSDPKFKKPAVSTRIQSMKGKLGDIKLNDPSVQDSPKRRSQRLEKLQRPQSESPSPKKERKSSRSSTPSEDRMVTRGQKGRLGSTSSNSEVEGSGDESRGKRTTRKDSRK